MIDLYTWLTPNGRKVSLMLEETGLPYQAVPINIGKGEQFDPRFRTINPNAKIPAILDQDGPGGHPLALFESGAILLYLAEKSGQLLPLDPVGRWNAIQWLQFQAAGVGPMLGQAQHFGHYATEKIPYAIERYRSEARRLYGVLDRRLSEVPYLAGDTYSIADIATWPWVRPWKIQGVVLAEYPAVQRWFEAIDARPAVGRERAVLAEYKSASSATLSDEARAHLFGGNAAPATA